MIQPFSNGSTRNNRQSVSLIHQELEDLPHTALLRKINNITARVPRPGAGGIFPPGGSVSHGSSVGKAGGNFCDLFNLGIFFGCIWKGNKKGVMTYR